MPHKRVPFRLAHAHQSREDRRVAVSLDQMRLGQNGHQAAPPAMFATDDQLARELEIAIKQLDQIKNGLSNLIAAVPSMVGMLSTVVGILAAVAAQLERECS